MTPDPQATFTATRALSPVMDVTEAMALACCRSKSAFYRWCAKWRVRPCSQGRYPRHQVMRALEREAGLRR